MSTHPFDDPQETYKVLVNEEGQYSLWPSFAAVPLGWNVAVEDTSRETCLKAVSESWSDMRPISLVHAVRSVD